MEEWEPDPEPLAVVAAHGSLGFAVHFAISDRIALVMAMFATRDRQFDLRSSTYEINRERNESQALFGNPAVKAIDLASMEEQLSAQLLARLPGQPEPQEPLVPLRQLAQGQPEEQ